MYRPDTVTITSRLEQTYLPMFGIFRPTTPIWQKAAEVALVRAQVDTWAFLSRQRGHEPEDFINPEEHGATYLRRSLACKAYQGVDTETYEQILGSLSLCDDEVEIPIQDFEVWGQRDQVVVATFPEEGPAISELRRNRRHLRRTLRDAGLPNLPLRRPDHVTLFRYEREINDPLLDEWQQERVLDTVYTAALETDLTTIKLGNIVLGYGYNMPIYSPQEEMPAAEPPAVFEGALPALSFGIAG